MSEAVEAEMRFSVVVHKDGTLEDITSAKVVPAVLKSAQPNPDYAAVKAQALSFDADDFWPELIPEGNSEKSGPVFDALVRWRTVGRERFRRGMPQARIVVMPDTSHYCFVQRQDEVVREMRLFLLQP